MESSSLLLADLLRLIGFSAALAGVLIAFAMHRRKHSAIESEQTPVALATRPGYRDTPTVRIMDSQHFDRLRRTARLAMGEQIDVLPAHPIVGPRFRVTLKEIAMRDATPAAHVEIVYCGVQVSCGPLAKEIGYNEFLVPRASRDESRTAIFHFHENGEELEFMRVKVNAIDLNARAIDIEVLQLRGTWPGTDA